MFAVDRPAGFYAAFVLVLTAVMGAHWHRQDLAMGADVAESARGRRGVSHGVRGVGGARAIRKGHWLDASGLLLGRDEHRRPVRIPAQRGHHILVVGATGSGKTVTQTWIAARLVAAGDGAIVIDPKGDDLLRAHLERSAQAAKRTFHEWTPDGPGVYNPFSHGSESEIADKALAGETYTEPHYLRQAQRYLGHAVRTLQQAGAPVTLAALADLLEPRRLERACRRLTDGDAKRVHAYLDSLTPDQVRGLAGTRDRLAVLAESDVAPWITGDQASGRAIDLVDCAKRNAVVYFRLDADRRPLLGAMMAAAIVQDLITVAAHYQGTAGSTLVLIDEFSAIAPAQVARLFGRARSAGLTMLLGTQELADLRPADHPNLADQVLGNVSTLIAHRQIVPTSAETIAAVAGTRATWVTTQRTDQLGFPTETGTRTRGREFRLHPDHIKQLPTGTAAVITPGAAEPRITRVLHPEIAS